MGAGTTVLLSDVEQKDTKKCIDGEKSKKVSFIDAEISVEKNKQKHQASSSAGRQIVPGLLLVASQSDSKYFKRFDYCFLYGIFFTL